MGYLEGGHTRGGTDGRNARYDRLGGYAVVAFVSYVSFGVLTCSRSPLSRSVFLSLSLSLRFAPFSRSLASSVSLFLFSFSLFISVSLFSACVSMPFVILFTSLSAAFASFLYPLYVCVRACVCVCCCLLARFENTSRCV